MGLLRRGWQWFRWMSSTSTTCDHDDAVDGMCWWPPFGLRTGGHAADAARILVCTLIDHYPLEMMNK